ncbi:MAG: precorrin-6y C5,15-methyltransferase (decarboxylating) subunit CbiE [Andreesenia angusta]|nr:precorrin-6y C5,15-methyltransferase (decarboxylating) subunit CbiE [Andreesenia angusta]
MSNCIELVGIGPGDLKYLTEEAMDTIIRADIIISFGRVANSISDLREDIKIVRKIEDIKRFLEEENEKKIVILASGDPCYYGINDYLIRNNISIDRVITGISSLQYMMSRLKRNYNDIISMSFHGRDIDFSRFEKGRSYFLLTDKINTVDSISKGLFDREFRGKMTIGANLSYEDELIEEKNIGDRFGLFNLSVVVVDIDVD